MGFLGKYPFKFTVFEKYPHFKKINEKYPL